MAEHATAEIDDRPEERESPVRHAHAVRARRHGRASTPGYLGLPADQDEGDGVDTDEDEDGARSQEGEESPQGEREDEENPRSRAPRARSAGKGSTSSGSKANAKRGAVAQRKTTSSRSAGRAGTKSKPGAKQARGASGGRSKGSATRGQSKSPKPAKSGSRAGSTRAGKGARKTSASRMSSASRSVGEPAAQRAKSAASAVKHTASSVADAAESGLGKRATGEALHLVGVLARHGMKVGARAAKRAATRALSRAGVAGADALLERAQRMPIQQSIDVAVPTPVAWEQWLEFTYFPEGTHRVVEVEREDGSLRGRLDGITSREWEAEIIDERENESFAWRSTKGSDSAGLVTFHELAERLTRIELNLDVRPTDLAEAAGLTLRLADHRVRSELRRFKAHAELLNPDIYDELLESSNGGPPEDEGASEAE
jgi:uncharacterized membrane protein